MQKELNLNEQDKDNLQYPRVTVTIPLQVLLKLDVERNKTNFTRSAFIRNIIEEFFLKKVNEKNDLENINKNLEEIKELVKNIK